MKIKSTFKLMINWGLLPLLIAIASPLEVSAQQVGGCSDGLGRAGLAQADGNVAGKRRVQQESNGSGPRVQEHASSGSDGSGLGQSARAGKRERQAKENHGVGQHKRNYLSSSEGGAS